MSIIALGSIAMISYLIYTAQRRGDVPEGYRAPGSQYIWVTLTDEERK